MTYLKPTSFPLFSLLFALLFLASNSILCKLAFMNQGIDPFSFTAIRLFSGAFVLWMLVQQRQKTFPPQKGSVFLGLMLFVYAICFSYSYVLIDTGIGALILFGMVQLTMIGYAMTKKTVSWQNTVGAIIAFIGLLVLLLPSSSNPISLKGFFLMATAGIAWGIYTLVGENIQHPLDATASNFFYASCYLLLFGLITLPLAHISLKGFLFALLSGSITSALGYVLWYGVVSKIQTSTASVIQLLVPLMSTVGGILWVNELLSVELLLSSLIILSGIALSSFGAKKI